MTAIKFQRGGSPAARGKWGKRFRSSRWSWGWQESKKEGAEMAVRRRPEPAGRGPEAAVVFRRLECGKAMGKVARKLPRIDVVLVVSSVRAKRGRNVGMTMRPSGSGGQDCRCGVLVA
jgi:hypothetical protein